MTLAAKERSQLIAITAAAVAVFVALRWLPTGTNLSHMDFRVDPKAGKAIDFCDPANPQFIPVVAAKSPVVMSVTLGSPAIIRLHTAGGKPLRTEDLLVTHTERLHLLIVDPTLRDYQHVHPQPTGNAGEWRFDFTPLLTGSYRFFADFTPAATARGLYASADATVTGEATARAITMIPGSEVLRDDHRFTLAVAPEPARVGKPIELTFSFNRSDGGAVALEPVMGAFAHLVAFDAARTGFAHLHPAESDLEKKPDRLKPSLNFKLTIPRAGFYTVWAQVKLGGKETFVPFGLEVAD